MAEDEGSRFRRLGMRYGCFLVNDGRSLPAFVRYYRARYKKIGQKCEAVIAGINAIRDNPVLMNTVLSKEDYEKETP